MQSKCLVAVIRPREALMNFIYSAAVTSLRRIPELRYTWQALAEHGSFLAQTYSYGVTLISRIHYVIFRSLCEVTSSAITRNCVVLCSVQRGPRSLLTVQFIRSTAAVLAGPRTSSAASRVVQLAPATPQMASCLLEVCRVNCSRQVWNILGI
jgi:hypothetical protein